MATEDGHPTTLFARYMRIVAKYWAFVLSVIAATWAAVTRIVGDLKDRWETHRLRSELEKRRKALTELGPGDPASQTADHATQQAQEALESHEKRVATAKAARPPLDKLRVGIGLAALVAAIMVANRGGNNETNQNRTTSSAPASDKSESPLSLANGPIPVQTFLAAFKEQRGSLEFSTPKDGNDVAGTPFERASLMTLRQFPKPHRFHLGSFDDSLISKMTIVVLQAGPDKQLVEVMLAKPFDTSNPNDRRNDNNNLIKLIDNHLLPGCGFREFYRENVSKIVLGGATMTYQGATVLALLKGKEVQVHISLQPNKPASSEVTQTVGASEGNGSSKPQKLDAVQIVGNMPTETPLAITATELYEAFQKDEAAATARFKDKWLAVSDLAWDGKDFPEHFADSLFQVGKQLSSKSSSKLLTLLLLNAKRSADKNAFVACYIGSDFSAFYLRLKQPPFEPVVGKCIGTTHEATDPKKPLMAVQLVQCHFPGVTDEKLPKAPKSTSAAKKLTYDTGFAEGSSLAEYHYAASQGFDRKTHLKGIIKPYEDEYVRLSRIKNQAPDQFAHAQGLIDGFRQKAKSLGVVVD